MSGTFFGEFNMRCNSQLDL